MGILQNKIDFVAFVAVTICHGDGGKGHIVDFVL